MLVDAQTHVAIASYTFENVTAPHVITAFFTYNGGNGGSSRGSDDDDDSSNSAPVVTPLPTTSANVGADRTVTQAVILAEAAQAAGGALRTQNATSIAPATLQTLAQAGNRMLHADTADAAGVQGRLYLNPAQLTGAKEPILLGVHTDDAVTRSTSNLFNRHFSNNIRVVNLAHPGSYGAEVQVAARVNLTGMNTRTLYFYAYDPKPNTYTLLPNPKDWVDSNGYLRFYTPRGGRIVITDHPLELKK